jgi:hypothetical protein
MKKGLLQKYLGILMLIITAFTPFPQSQGNPIEIDNFEKYSSDIDIQKAYAVWNDGALLDVFIQEQSGDQSMRVDIISPNSVNQSTNGSIYHVLSGSLRNWSDGSAVRFWVNNSFDKPLLLSLNFKEAYNEYWAIANQGVFFLQDDEGSLLQQGIEYGNLPLKANYQGWVLIPFFSFDVPEWNTARGDRILDLARIESIAFSVNIGEDYPRSFSIDDIEILPLTDLKPLDIQGSRSIQVPASGEHHELYSAFLVSPVDDSSQPVDVLWSLADPHDGLISIDENGDLIIPAGVQEPSVTLSVTFPSMDNPITEMIKVELTGSQLTPTENAAAQSATAIPFQPTISAYDQFSQNFEVWAVQNRPLFVILSVGAVLLILIILTLLQRRLK